MTAFRRTPAMPTLGFVVAIGLIAVPLVIGGPASAKTSDVGAKDYITEASTPSFSADLSDLFRGFGAILTPDMIADYFGRSPEETDLNQAIAKAEQGDADAQIVVGQSYLSGTGTDPDKQEAWRWFQMAADQGDARGAYWVGVLYSRNITLPQFREQALSWLKKSAAADYGPGIEALALLRLRLNGPTKPVVKLLRRAKKAGGEMAAQALETAEEQRKAEKRAAMRAEQLEKARQKAARKEAKRAQKAARRAAKAEERRLARQLEEDRRMAAEEEARTRQAQIATTPNLGGVLDQLGGQGHSGDSLDSPALDSFVRDYVRAVNAKDEGKLLGLVHPASRSCNAGATKAYFGDVLAKDMANTIGVYSVTSRAIGPTDPLYFNAMFDYPQRPSGEIELSFKGPDGQMTSFLRQVVRLPDGSYQMIIPCPNPDGLKWLEANDSDVQPAPAAMPKAGVNQIPILPDQPIDLDRQKFGAPQSGGTLPQPLDLDASKNAQTSVRTDQGGTFTVTIGEGAPKPSTQASLRLVGGPDVLPAAGKVFFRAYKSAIVNKNRANLEGLIHPAFSSCRTAANEPYYEFLFKSDLGIDFTSEPRIQIYEVAAEGNLPYAERFTYPVRPTHRLSIDFPLPSDDPNVRISKSETRDLIATGDTWYYAPPCPTPAGLKELKAFGLIP